MDPKTTPWHRSLVTRLVLSSTCCAAAMSFGLGWLEYDRSTKLAMVSTSQRLHLLAYNVQQALRPMIASRQHKAMVSALEIFAQDPLVSGLRLTTDEGTVCSSSDWPTSIRDTVAQALSAESGQSQVHIDRSRPTRLVAPFSDLGRTHTLEVLIDGPAITRQARLSVVDRLSALWIMLGLLMLLGLLLMRRWLVSPLEKIVKLATAGAPARQFEQVAAGMQDELGALSGSIGRMLRRLDDTTRMLREREQAFWHLYQFAPASMISIDRAGMVIEANRRAAELFGVATEAELIGRDILTMMRPEDRGRLRQAVDRLEFQEVNRCELCVQGAGGSAREVTADFMAVYDDQGDLWRVRLSLLDISESKKLIRQFSRQRHLMDLVINHMSDAILLVGSDGKIITANHRLGELLRVNVAELPGHDFEPMDLWSRLDLLKPDIFEQRMALLSQSPQQSLQEQFESRDGCHLFQVIPVLDEQRARIGHLWIVQDFSAQTRGKQLLERQEAQLRALRRVGRHLQASQGLDATLHRIVEDLNKIFEVEAVGLVLRTPHGATRNRHLLWLDPHQTTLADGLLLRDLISEHLMPQVLPNRSTTFFPDVLQHGAWGRGLWNAGLETLAATAVISRDQSQGMIWIARRGGRPITDHHLNLLEALAPLLASAIDNASLREQLREHQLTDPLTDLPTARTIPLAIARQVHRPGHPWSVMVLELDHFAQMIAALGHEAGDAALRRVAQTLRRILRSTDHIARQEPDRFVIICPDIERHHAAHLADRLRAAIASESLSEPGSPPVRLTCSVGVAGSPADHHEGRTLEIAHARLRAAQAAGRNRVESMAQAR